jgi:cation transporter-like permease
MMAGMATPPSIGAEGLRGALILGAAMFLAAGFLGSVFADAFLAYPPGFAKALIIAIEAGMMISVAATLALLVAGPPRGSAKP